MIKAELQVCMEFMFRQVAPVKQIHVPYLFDYKSLSWTVPCIVMHGHSRVLIFMQLHDRGKLLFKVVFYYFSDSYIGLYIVF